MEETKRRWIPNFGRARCAHAWLLFFSSARRNGEPSFFFAPSPADWETRRRGEPPKNPFSSSPFQVVDKVEAPASAFRVPDILSPAEGSPSLCTVSCTRRALFPLFYGSVPKLPQQCSRIPLSRPWKKDEVISQTFPFSPFFPPATVRDEGRIADGHLRSRGNAGGQMIPK